MLTEKLTYEDIVTKTVEALFGAGLKSRSIQNSYCKYYDMLGKYLDARGIRHYDIGARGICVLIDVQCIFSDSLSLLEESVSGSGYNSGYSSCNASI